MSRVQKLRDELARKVNTGTLSEPDLLTLRERVGTLVVQALDDEAHPLAEQLLELKTVIDRHRKSPRPQTSGDATDMPMAVMSSAHFFMPQPGISLPMRQFWPLQLLLHEAAQSARREALAVRLELAPGTLDQHLKQGAKCSTGLWSLPQHGTFLLQALLCLEYPDPPLRLEGTTLKLQGQANKLSRQQTQFVQLLIENAGQWVEHETFRQRDIGNPVKIFCALNKKAALKDITLPIDSRNGAYRLADRD